MFRSLITFLIATLALSVACPALTNTSPKTTPATEKSDAGAQQAAKPAFPAGEKPRVMVIEIREPIDKPPLYVLRRGLKEAEAQKYDIVIVNMKTPGGELGATLEMIELLRKFSGTTISYINDEAISAGAFIAAGTNEIWFAPQSVIGASAAVSMGGQEIPETMRLKVTSFVKGKIRAITEGHGFRGQVIEAMIDKDYELIIDDIVIKPKGQLLSLTATEAMALYGNPKQPLLGTGIAADINNLLEQKLGSSEYEITQFQTTWSEKMGSWLNSSWLGSIKPFLLGLGLLALFMEFKTPGFGFFGIAAIAVFGLWFLMNYGAGLSGHEPMIVFAIGFVLVILELLFFPGVMVAVITGLLMMLGSLVWAMADFWPGDPISVAWTTDALVAPVTNLGIGLLIGAALILALLRFMPKSWFWDRIELSGEITGAAQVAGLAPEEAGMLDSLIGRRARVVTPLRPFGQVEIDGKFYEARLPLGSAERDTTVIVRGYNDFSLDVEPADTPKEGNA